MDSEDKLDEIHRILMEFDFQNPRQDNFRLMKLVMEVLERMVTRLEKKQEKPERVAFNQIVEYISVNLRLEQLTPASSASVFTSASGRSPVCLRRISEFRLQSILC
jgi:ferric iron reductase protein FhuF